MREIGSELKARGIAIEAQDFETLDALRTGAWNELHA